MTKLLLIDDEPTITEPLARRLRTRGFQVDVADNGKIGLAMALDRRPELVILDVMMPEMDGWEVCKRLRAESSVPILMLTALDEEFDRVTGLDLGADDYLAKPFGTNELIARINALLRRVQLDKAEQTQHQPMIITSGPFTLNATLRTVTKAGDVITLRQKEFELLQLLMQNAGVPVTRAQIFDVVWGTSWLGDTRTLDVHIRGLREKLEAEPSKPSYLCTLRGIGYIFKKES